MEKVVHHVMAPVLQMLGQIGTRAVLTYCFLVIMLSPCYFWPPSVSPEIYKIEETVPKERAYYSRVLTWVSKDSKLPLQRDYYDVAGKLWKTETFEEEKIDGVPTAIRIQMKDVQGKSTTELRVTDVRYNVDVPDALFDPLKLSTAANSPVWQSTTASATSSR